VNLSRAIDVFAPSTDSAAPSIDPSMAQQSVDRAALSTDPIWCWSKSSHLFLVLMLQSGFKHVNCFIAVMFLLNSALHLYLMRHVLRE